MLSSSAPTMSVPPLSLVTTSVIPSLGASTVTQAGIDLIYQGFRSDIAGIRIEKKECRDWMQLKLIYQREIERRMEFKGMLEQMNHTLEADLQQLRTDKILDRLQKIEKTIKSILTNNCPER